MVAEKQNPKAIRILRVRRTRRTIFIKYEHGDEEKTINSTDNPRKGFLDAIEGLLPLACSIAQVGPNYADEMRVMGLDLTLVGGVDAVAILAQKSLALCGKAMPLHIPPVLLRHPTQEGRYTPPLAEADGELIWAVIEGAKEYVKGDRAQGQLAILDEAEEGEEEAQPEEGEELPLEEPEPVPAGGGESDPEEKPKRGRPRKKRD